MRSNRRTLARRYGRNDGSFWLSFSDLMSSLVLIIILVMFYIIYQYFNLAEINQAEIARRQYQLDEAQAELETQQGKLSEAETRAYTEKLYNDMPRVIEETIKTEDDIENYFGLPVLAAIPEKDAAAAKKSEQYNYAVNPKSRNRNVKKGAKR